MTFLSQVNDLILDNFPTYKPWAESIGYFMLACASWKAYLPGGGLGLPLTFNPWCIGPSRLAFKSTASSIVKPILKGCGIHIETEYTSEKFTTDAQQIFKKEGSFHCAIVRDETSGLIANVNKRYNSDGLSFLSKLLDPGVIDSRNTHAHGLEEDIPVRVNFISACTPQVFSIIDVDFWTQGLGNRLTPDYVTERILNDSCACPNKTDAIYFQNRIDGCIAELKHHIAANVEKIIYAPDVDELTTQVEFTKRRKCTKDYFEDIWSIIPSYEYECQVTTKKIAALIAIDEQPNESGPTVYMPQYKRAEAWIADRFAEFIVIHDKWAECRDKNLMRSRSQSVEEKILSYIKRHGSITYTELNNNVAGDSVEKKKVMEAMWSMKKLNQVETSKGHKYVLVESQCK